ncbi:hypothetical protein Q31b_01050 [Novipirellula aureliae]|uniref:Bacteriophage T5 Orf172 DNA-binding domain-containing protein n=1 Tax=Novipirellula aureliae TaxID=2527966 RepID=A0A5C6E8P6_9BACT|nr:GIY-YIG nuclease family protein [Novipirellula aureliae]TWU44934.1 hypothetical protein Q31b_01050 [Novipirellula aureliae]
MKHFEEELERILADDPLGLLDVKPKPSNAITADQRLVASFEEINAFYREYNREPGESRDIGERRLFSRLKGLRDSPARAAALKDYDVFDLLGDVKNVDPATIESIDDVLNDDTLGLLDVDCQTESDPEDIFDLKHVSKTPEKPDHVAKRKACKEFDQFEPLFQEQHALMQSGMRVTVPFRSERQIREETFFVLDGLLVYVGKLGKWQKKKHGNYNARLYCVFGNGTESNMLLRSLASALWKDKTSRQIIDAHQRELFESEYAITQEDEATGYIYVLRSLSDDPRIQEIDDLFKVGFSSQPVDHRTANATKDPTFLMADVMPVTHFATYNLNPQQLEKLLHRFFAKACLNLDIFDATGQRHTPREWFVVPLHIIEAAVNLLINGEIVNYRYDELNQEIIEK